MGVFAITFRIGELGDDIARRASLVQRVHREAIGAVWEETTAFLLIESRTTAPELADALYFGSEMNAAWDRLLVVDLTTKAYAARGKTEFPATLAQLMAKR